MVDKQPNDAFNNIENLKQSDPRIIALVGLLAVHAANIDFAMMCKIHELATKQKEKDT